MSRSGRKRVSKWDLEEEPQLFQGGSHSGTWPWKAGESVHSKESQHSWHSPPLAASTDPEWYVIESNNKDNRQFSDVMPSRHGDGRHNTKMSPGLDEWRQQNHSRSPRNSRDISYRSWSRSRSHSHSHSRSRSRSCSRSRSRSPPYGFKRESGLDERSIAAQTCRDFATGRCRRGDRCPYLHQDDRVYEDRRRPEGFLTKSWDSRHRRGGASNYSYSDGSREYPQRMGRSNDAHHGAASGKGSAREVFRKRENDMSKYTSFEHSREHEPRRSGLIPCKFFAVGNCRNGKFCRFSHDGQTTNYDDRSEDDWRRRRRKFSTMEQPGEHLRWSDTTVSDNARLREHRNENDAHERRGASYSKDDRWVHRFNIENRFFGQPTNTDKAVDNNEREYLQPKAETAGTGTGGVELKGAENWFDDMEISSPWNGGQSSTRTVKEGSSRISQTPQSLTLNETSLPTYEQDITGEILGQKHPAAAAIAPMISENDCFQSIRSSREDAGYAFALEVGKATTDCAVSNIDLNKAVDSNEREYLQPKAETTDTGTGGVELKGAENWFGDMEISSPWNGGQSSAHIVKERGSHITQTPQFLTLNETSLPTYEQDVTGDILGQKHQAAAAMASMIPENDCFQSNPSSREDADCAFALEVRKATTDCGVPSIDLNFSANILPGQSLDHNGHSSSTVTRPHSSPNAAGQNQKRFPLYSPRGEIATNAQNQPLFQEDKSFSTPRVSNEIKSELTSEIPTQNIVSREQLSQLTNLSALAQLFGNVQQLPNLSVVPNPPKSVEFVPSSLSNPAGPVNTFAAASIDPNLVIGSERHYGPLGGLSGGDQYKMGNSEVELDQERHRLDQVNPIANCDVEEKNGTAAEESKKAQENGPLEEKNGDGSPEEGKKKNDEKGIRAFKFSLVEFVKEILKPKWKEGQINKESHKTIVKKVVEKVTGSIQGAHIPQTQDKIDNYLSSSKLKLTKLVEAYVEKYQKS